MKDKYQKTVYACFVGYIVQAIVNNFVPLLFLTFEKSYHIPLSQITMLITFNFGIQLLIDLLSAKFVDRIGYRISIVLAHVFSAAGLICLVILPDLLPNAFAGLFISVVIYAVGGGLIEVLISPIVESCPSDNKEKAMSLLHSFYCWGQAVTALVTTLLVKSFGYANWMYIPLIWAIVPFINMFSFFKVPIIEPEPERKSDKLRDLLSSRVFRCFMVMMFCAGASEIAMAEWASMFAQKALGVSKVVGDLAGPCAFAVFMGTGRILYAKFSEKISFRKAVVAMCALCAACYLTAAFSKNPLLALVSCAVCGFTVSILWPGTYSAGARVFPRGDAVMYSVFAMCGDLGCCLGPWILGIIADALSLNIGFAVSAVFPIIMLVTALMFLKEKDCKTDA